MTTKTDEQELLPCPFCGAGTTEIQENGRPWLGTRGWGDPVSVSVRHCCEPVDGQPSRMIERVGRDRAAAIAAWNRRAALQSQDREDALRYRWLRDNALLFSQIEQPGVSGWMVGRRDHVKTRFYTYNGKELDKAIDHDRRA